MAGKPPKTEVALAFLKLSFDHRSNRCAQCGRRLKYQPGAFITSSGLRFMTCRSCGFENPTLTEKVAEYLSEAGYDVYEGEGVLDLPACLGDGSELQVSKDFSKVFCGTCAREWDRYEFEDIMGGPLSPQLAGALPFKAEISKVSEKLEALLEKNNVDAGLAYLVAEIPNKPLETINPLKIFVSSFKEGWNQERDKKSSSGIATPTSHDDTFANSAFVAIYEDYIAHYSWGENSLITQEWEFDELFSQPKLSIPFDTMNLDKNSAKKIMDLLNRFRIIHSANANPYAPELFGSAAKEANAKVETDPAGIVHISLADELSKLAELNAQGVLTEAEFLKAKSKLLENL
jgi:hypothetical protein